MRTFTPFTADDLSMQWDAETKFPFAENEDANITGYGHQDKAQFAAEINRYDKVCNGGEWDEPGWEATDIGHKYAVRISEELCTAWLPLDDPHVQDEPVGPDTPGAFPITTLWGQR